MVPSLTSSLLLLSAAKATTAFHADNFGGGLQKSKLLDGEYYFFNLDLFGQHLSWSALSPNMRLALKSPHTMSGLTKWLVRGRDQEQSSSADFTLTNQFEGIRGMRNNGKTIYINSAVEGTGFTKYREKGSYFHLEQAKMPHGYPGVAYYIKAVDPPRFTGDAWLGIENGKLRFTDSGRKTKFMVIPASKDYTDQKTFNPLVPPPVVPGTPLTEQD